jgi:hypothetical protein
MTHEYFIADRLHKIKICENLNNLWCKKALQRNRIHLSVHGNRRLVIAITIAIIHQVI